MARVFISYCHDDTSTIDRLDLMSYFGDLNPLGYAVWSDRNLRTGDDWNSVLVDPLDP